ncbi:integrase core domain-containing protein [Nocardia aurea]|uniref:integrase core domain-containing protein n=1 Tax=Nocardia aurea TaxID=2144174 RepID=UPI0033B9B034
MDSFNRRLRAACLIRNHWTCLLEARVVIGDFKTDHNLRHRHSALGYRTPAEYAAAAPMPTTRWTAGSTETDETTQGSNPRWSRYRGLAIWKPTRQPPIVRIRFSPACFGTARFSVAGRLLFGGRVDQSTRRTDHADLTHRFIATAAIIPMPQTSSTAKREIFWPARPTAR